MASILRQPYRSHSFRIRIQQRLYLAIVLIVALPAGALAGDVRFDPEITEEEFRKFSGIVSQAIFSNPVEPARSQGIFNFDIGIAVNAVPVDEDAAYWIRSGAPDLIRAGHLMVPRIVVSKGLVFATISGSYARIPDSGVSAVGGSLDVPIIPGGVTRPTLAIRGTYSQVRGVDELSLRNYGAELHLSKGFGPVTPYAGVGLVRTRSIGELRDFNDEVFLRMEDEFDQRRLTLGVRISLLVPKIVVEATQGEERSYAAKVSLGW